MAKRKMNWICKKCSPVECKLNGKEKPDFCFWNKSGKPDWQKIEASK